MFVRTRIINGKPYGQVVESVRTPNGPRQRILASFTGATIEDGIARADRECQFWNRMVGYSDRMLAAPMTGYLSEWCCWKPGNPGTTGGRRLRASVIKKRAEFAKKTEKAQEQLNKLNGVLAQMQKG